MSGHAFLPQLGCLVWYFDPRIIPGTSHKLRSFWAGPYLVTKLIALALAEMKLVYYLGEERLVGLYVLKLYWGEVIICQNPKGVDPDCWLEEGRRLQTPWCKCYQRSQKMWLEEKERRDTWKNQGRATKEAEARVQEQMEPLPQWFEVPGLILHEENDEEMLEDTAKRKRDEVSRGWRKRQIEENIRVRKREHSPSVQVCLRKPNNFNS